MSTAQVQARVPGGARLVALRLFQYTALFGSNVLVARALGPSERAQYALPIALMAVVFVIVELSIEHSSGRALARRQASLGELFGVASVLSAGCGLAGAALCCLIGLLAADQLLAGTSFLAVALAAASLPLALAAKDFGGLLLRVGRFGAFGVVNAASGAVQLAGVAGFLAGPGLTVERALAVLLASNAVLAAGSVVCLAQELRRRDHEIALPPRAVFTRLLRDGVILQGAAIGLFLMFRIDLLIVAVLTNAKETGLYSLATSLAEILFVTAAALAQLTLPRLTEDPPDLAARFVAIFTRRIVTVSAVGAAVLAAVSYPTIVVLYGHEWKGSVVPLVILAVAAVAITLAWSVYGYLVREGRLRDISVITLGSLAANIVLNLMLIPLIGIIGAALASLVTYWALGLLLALRFRRLAASV